MSDLEGWSRFVEEGNEKEGERTGETGEDSFQLKKITAAP